MGIYLYNIRYRGEWRGTRGKLLEARKHLFTADAYMDVGGTRPWKVEGRTMQEAIVEIQRQLY